MLSKTEREELSNLSQKLFGTRSAWQKILKNGMTISTESITGAMERRKAYSTVEDLKKFMETKIAEIDDMVEKQKKLAIEKAQKEIIEEQAPILEKLGDQ
jgi:esterase/lipase superfamily enzyme